MSSDELVKILAAATAAALSRSSASTAAYVDRTSNASVSNASVSQDEDEGDLQQPLKEVRIVEEWLDTRGLSSRHTC